MIKRIVRLTFQEDKVETFQELFENTKSLIRNFPGCQHLELLQDINQRNVFFTWSYWESEEALDVYRHSELFKTTWKKTKILFSDKPAARSLELVSETNL